MTTGFKTEFWCWRCFCYSWNSRQQVLGMEFWCMVCKSGFEKSVWQNWACGFVQRNVCSWCASSLLELDCGTLSRTNWMDQRRPVLAIQRGVKQGDIMSPLLFNCGLEVAMNRWKHRLVAHGFDVNRLERLTNIRYADDLILFAKSSAELVEMIELLNEELAHIGLTLNSGKQPSSWRHTHCKTQLWFKWAMFSWKFWLAMMSTNILAKSWQEICATEGAWKLPIGARCAGVSFTNTHTSCWTNMCPYNSVWSSLRPSLRPRFCMVWLPHPLQRSTHWSWMRWDDACYAELWDGSGWKTRAGIQQCVAWMLGWKRPAEFIRWSCGVILCIYQNFVRLNILSKNRGWM